jgi:hypothetical protein
LSQMNEKEQDKPIFFASRALSKAERNYSTIERELLAIIFGVQKFKYYLMGKLFVSHTDHNPLTYLNNLTISSSRLTRWRLKLSEYDFTIEYKKGKANSNPDALSRIELESETIRKEDAIEHLLAIEAVEKEPIEDKIVYRSDDFMKSKIKTIAVCSTKDLKAKTGILSRLLNLCEKDEIPLRHNKRVGDCLVRESNDGHTIAFMLTRKHSNKNPSLNSFQKSIKNLLEYCKRMKINEITLPKIEGGLDRLKWIIIARTLNKELIDQGIKCYVFTNRRNIEKVIENTEESTENTELLTRKENNELNMNNRLKELQENDKEIKELIEKKK